jgi:hypothetical protein
LIRELRLRGGGHLEDDVAAHVGNAQVDQKDIDMLRADGRKRCFAGLCGGDIVARPRQCGRQCFADRRLVVDDENAHRSVPARRLFAERRRNARRRV